MLIALRMACTDGKPETGEAEPLALDEAGPWRVGYRESSVPYADPDGEGERTLRLALWFPTEDESGAEARYMGAIAAPGVYQDAGPAAGPFPLAIFSHG